MALSLFTRAFGTPSASPVVLLHGLFGSSANWQGIARRLAASRRVLVPDLRGHGRSPGGAPLTFPGMSGDLIALLDAEGIDRAVLVGHSMGGKAAMWLALAQPQRVHALVVVDIAPVAYRRRFNDVVDALCALDLERIGDRREADSLLADRLPDASLRGYLLQNLVREGSGWGWRIDLPALRLSVDEIRGFPRAEGRQYPGPVLFVYGTASDYVSGEHLPAIRGLFPHARLRAIPGAGHWVYSDQPEAFARALESFLRE